VEEEEREEKRRRENADDGAISDDDEKSGRWGISPEDAMPTKEKIQQAILEKRKLELMSELS